MGICLLTDAGKQVFKLPVAILIYAHGLCSKKHYQLGLQFFPC